MRPNTWFVSQTINMDRFILSIVCVIAVWNTIVEGLSQPVIRGRTDIDAGTFVSFTCEVDGAANSTPHITWRYNVTTQVPLTSTSNDTNVNNTVYTATDGSQMHRASSNLTVMFASGPPEFNLVCQAFHMESNTSKTAQVKILLRGPPVVMQPNSSLLVNTGDEVTITCTISSNPTLTAIVWYKDSIVLSVERYVYGTPNNPSIRMSSLTDADTGLYVCLAVNSMATANGTGTHLHVRGKRDFAVSTVCNKAYTERRPGVIRCVVDIELVRAAQCAPPPSTVKFEGILCQGGDPPYPPSNCGSSVEDGKCGCSAQDLKEGLYSYALNFTVKGDNNGLSVQCSLACSGGSVSVGPKCVILVERNGTFRFLNREATLSNAAIAGIVVGILLGISVFFAVSCTLRCCGCGGNSAGPASARIRVIWVNRRGPHRPSQAGAKSPASSMGGGSRKGSGVVTPKGSGVVTPKGSKAGTPRSSIASNKGQGARSIRFSDAPSNMESNIESNAESNVDDASTAVSTSVVSEA